MTAEECHQHAADCAANADLCLDHSIAMEFMRLAAHWRAMALREIFLGHVREPLDLFAGLPTAGLSLA